MNTHRLCVYHYFNRSWALFWRNDQRTSYLCRERFFHLQQAWFLLLCSWIVSRHCWDRTSCHKPKVCQERSLSTKQYSLFWDSTSACVPTPFFYERGGSTSDPGRLITSARSLAFHNRSLKQTHDRQILTDEKMLERKKLKDKPKSERFNAESKIGKAVGKDIPRNPTLFSNQEITASSMTLKIVSCLLLTFPSLSHGVWIWKKSLFVHGGRSIHALDPSSKKKG